MRHILNRIAVLALISTAVACAGEPEQEAAPAVAADSAAPMHDMPGMGGGDMAPGMRQHMSMMQGVSADSMKAMMQSHRQMAANMLSQMNQQMRSMNMPADTAWNALADSLRADLTRLPELSGAGLQRLMTEHHQRINRLMDMHAAMMKNMGM